MFWNIQRVLSYCALFNFIIGNRGGGKTYGCKKFVIQRFLKTGKQFIYLRRYKKELKRIRTFFDDIAKEFPEHEFKVKGTEFYIDNELAGYAFCLSTSKIEKSTAFPNVYYIIFDEFILDKGVYRYLTDEITYFLEFYETVCRLRENPEDEPVVFFLANAITMTNPYFLYFDIKLPYGKTIYCKDDKLIELVQNQEFIEAKKRTRFGKLIAGTEYAAYSIENEFLRDNNTFIEKKSGNCSFVFGFKYKGITYGVWRSYEQGKIWVSTDYDKNYKGIYVLTREDMTPNALLLSSLHSSKKFKNFIENYKRGCVFYEDIKIKTICWEVVKLAGIY